MIIWFDLTCFTVHIISNLVLPFNKMWSIVKKGTGFLYLNRGDSVMFWFKVHLSICRMISLLQMLCSSRMIGSTSLVRGNRKFWRLRAPSLLESIPFIKIYRLIHGIDRETEGDSRHWNNPETLIIFAGEGLFWRITHNSYTNSFC